MTVINTTTRVSPDGNVTVPVGIANAGKQVQVIVTDAANSELINGIPRDEWFAILDRTAGSIDDETFCRPPQRPQRRKIEFDE